MPLVIALNRGRILAECLPLLAEAGIEPDEDVRSSRKLIFPTRRGGHKLVIMRGADVPTYITHGTADIGVVGKDTLLEAPPMAGYYERLDLNIARCRIVTAFAEDAPARAPRLPTSAQRHLPGGHQVRQRQPRLLCRQGVVRSPSSPWPGPWKSPPP